MRQGLFNMYSVASNCVNLSWSLPLCVLCVYWQSLYVRGSVRASCVYCAAARCYSSTKSKPEAKETLYAPLKLPGELGTMTGSVMYPDEKSAVWDVNSEWYTLSYVFCVLYKHIHHWMCTNMCILTFITCPSPPLHSPSPPLPSHSTPLPLPSPPSPLPPLLHSPPLPLPSSTPSPCP